MKRASIAPVSANRLAGLRGAELSREEQESVIALALSVLAARYRPGTPVTSPGDTRRYLTLRATEHKNEVF